MVDVNLFMSFTIVDFIGSRFMKYDFSYSLNAGRLKSAVAVSHPLE